MYFTFGSMNLDKRDVTRVTGLNFKNGVHYFRIYLGKKYHEYKSNNIEDAKKEHSRIINIFKPKN